MTGNSANFETLMESMLGQAEDLLDASSQKAAFAFFNKCVGVWGKPVGEGGGGGSDVDQEGLPGFDRFIYERIIPLAFRVASSPNFNLKDGQVVVVRRPFLYISHILTQSTLFFLVRLFKRFVIYYRRS